MALDAVTSATQLAATASDIAQGWSAMEMVIGGLAVFFYLVFRWRKADQSRQAEILKLYEDDAKAKAELLNTKTELVCQLRSQVEDLTNQVEILRKTFEARIAQLEAKIEILEKENHEISLRRMQGERRSCELVKLLKFIDQNCPRECALSHTIANRIGFAIANPDESLGL